MKLYELEEPRVIQGDVNVPHAIDVLDYNGTTVLGHFNCGETKIKTLEGSPRIVSGYFDCTHTDIRSLKGAPKEIGLNLYAFGTKITSLKDVHKYITSIRGDFYAPDILKSNILGLLKLKTLRSVILQQGSPALINAVNIINKYLYPQKGPLYKNIHKCQEEMLEVGLEWFARL